ncbi:PREDICTED: E3 ubiquitin-protein ligase RNF14-like [Cyprinodon variegatus]|uniref:RBR-type E3 ubiquitin transferase n=1 Tax=Cyprinodon variegatus TaxID=28743 RepID=A0A3Q2FT40_CYPVA|nr:PREDICTED: E3 ubiquitin-protein ligase RNF14-like [Cyprinodon variegatus]XP_015248810.1 PREDICTED: E3 ubiquitin-protein ligase RNF14-like [Cyprinodon variegatus]XP_015248811.1 PREDICTED: E3 ubiquitin-protein ligase RNF14-like [Cyprinodon variegatus]
MNMDLEEQENELLALQSIFSSGEFLRNESESAGEFRVSVELPAGFSVLLNNGETTRQYEVSFLPPLLLTFTLPDDYPSSSPPSFTLTCSWLTQSQLMSLSNQLTELYQATGGTVVLFSWMQFLREDALKHLDIHTLLELPSDSSKTPQINQIKQDDDSEAGEQKRNPKSGSLNAQNHLSANLSSGDAVNNSNFRLSKSSESTDNCQKDLSSKAEKPELPGSVSVRQEVVHGINPNKDQEYSGLSLTPSQMLLSQILIHDADQKQKVFASRLFDCGVCFSNCLGSECVQLYECGHIFCRACLRDFCKAQITEGNVGGVTCPQPDCPATPTPAQVKCLVGEELFHRYDQLLLQSTLDRMPDITYCPRHSCGAAVILEKSYQAAMCSVCSFAFCVDCKKTYHGTSKCYEEPKMSEQMSEDPLKGPPQTAEGMKALLEDYAKGSKRRRHLLERRYGRKLLLYTIEKHATSMWIAGNTKPCPHCFCPIQKDGGCNRVYCTQCYRPFNWQ